MIKSAFTLATGTGRRACLSTLVFHRVLPDPDPIFPEQMHAARFDQICSWLREWFNVLPLEEAVRRLAEGRLPERALAITFDDGYADNREQAAPILRRHGLPGTFFVTTGMLDGGLMWNDVVVESLRRTRLTRVDLAPLRAGLGEHDLGCAAGRRRAIEHIVGQVKYLEPSARRRCVDAVADVVEVEPPRDLMMSSQQVRELRSFGLQVGAHTVSHPILLSLTQAEAKAEIVESRRHLESIVGEPVRLFAYPNGKPGDDYGALHVDMVRDAGFEAATSTQWGVSTIHTDRFQLRRFSPWDRTRTRFALRMLANIVMAAPEPALQPASNCLAP